MKNKIYIILITILVLVSLTVVLLYYTQDFNEEFEFINSINYADIEVETNTYNDQIVYLRSAKARIGELTLENDGIFTQLYRIPQLIGCIELNDGIDKNSVLLRNTRFYAEFNSDGSKITTEYYSSKGRQIKIEVGEEKTYSITGYYNPRNVPFSQFSRDTIKGISLYIIPEKESNPLSDDYSYRSLRNSNDCSSIDPDLDPIATININ